LAEVANDNGIEFVSLEKILGSTTLDYKELETELNKLMIKVGGEAREGFENLENALIEAGYESKEFETILEQLKL
jgi:hypothetical protein